MFTWIVQLEGVAFTWRFPPRADTSLQFPLAETGTLIPPTAQLNLWVQKLALCPSTEHSARHITGAQ